GDGPGSATGADAARGVARGNEEELDTRRHRARPSLGAVLRRSDHPGEGAAGRAVLEYEIVVGVRCIVPVERKVPARAGLVEAQAAHGAGDGRAGGRGARRILALAVR